MMRRFSIANRLMLFIPVLLIALTIVVGFGLSVLKDRLLEDRKVEYAKEMSRYAKAHGGRIDLDVTEHMSNWADNHPMDFSKVPGFTPPAPDPYEVEINKRKATGNYKP